MSDSVGPDGVDGTSGQDGVVNEPGGRTYRGAGRATDFAYLG